LSENESKQIWIPRSGATNPLPPSDAVRKYKNYFRGSFELSIVTVSKISPSGNLKFNNLGIFQSLKLRFSKEKFLPISLMLNFTPNILGWYGLKAVDGSRSWHP